MQNKFLSNYKYSQISLRKCTIGQPKIWQSVVCVSCNQTQNQQKQQHQYLPDQRNYKPINDAVFVNRRQQIQYISSCCLGIFLAQESSAISVVETIKGNENQRDIQILSSGVRYSDIKTGSGEIPKVGDTIMMNLIGSLENGTEFINTEELGVPIVGELGITNKGIPDGLQDVIRTMNAGSRRLVIVPAGLAFGSDKSTSMPKANVPPNSVLYYDIELLRCQKLQLGLACCPEEQYPCFADDPSEQLKKAAVEQQQ
eukprot:TRINITY_DN7113_c0_g2_i1.p2 TRINITY_DN7113_c0_g2~~TRINITY_DN7113_c0_g2_i1.p2  ORF type:complete len:256 (-),score=20.98 TRINITY_DN7113_c0_g2_i1:572-1339(-)